MPLIAAVIAFLGGRYSATIARENAQALDQRAEGQQQHEYVRWALERAWSSTNALEAQGGLAILEELRREGRLNSLDKRVALAAIRQLNQPVLDQMGDPTAGKLAELPPEAEPGTQGPIGGAL